MNSEAGSSDDPKRADGDATSVLGLSLPARLAIALVRGYQVVLGPILGGRCRFHPSCSTYAILAIRKYGCLKGCWRAAGRLCRCQPFHPGGVDYP